MEPTQFGNYTLLERISHGGMAEVYRARSFGEAGFERDVALKLLLPSVASDQEFVTMLIDEAKIAGQLNHANIAQIFDLGIVDERYFIVQEFVAGQDLRELLKGKSRARTKLKISIACHITIKICEGLHYAHNKRDHFGKRLNLVHRDISPHNILISDEGEVKIIDFGIAKAEGRSTQTMAGLIKGKFAYMSPEQIRGLPVDHRSDVFATGIVLHEMLTCKPLFQGRSEFETLKRARAAKVPPPSALNPKVPDALNAITLKALARHVDDRYQSSRELRDALWEFAIANNAFAEQDHLISVHDPRRTSESQIGEEEHSASMQLELASELGDVPENYTEIRMPSVLDQTQDEIPTGEEEPTDDVEPPTVVTSAVPHLNTDRTSSDGVTATRVLEVPWAGDLITADSATPAPAYQTPAPIQKVPLPRATDLDNDITAKSTPVDRRSTNKLPSRTLLDSQEDQTEEEVTSVAQTMAAQRNETASPKGPWSCAEGGPADPFNRVTTARKNREQVAAPAHQVATVPSSLIKVVQTSPPRPKGQASHAKTSPFEHASPTPPNSTIQPVSGLTAKQPEMTPPTSGFAQTGSQLPRRPPANPRRFLMMAAIFILIAGASATLTLLLTGR